SSDGLITRTIVVDKNAGQLQIEIKSIQNGNLISDAKEYIDLKNGKISLIKIKTRDGEVKEIVPDKSAEDFTSLEFQKKGMDKIKVPAGEFMCDRYRAIYDDYVIDAWINDDIPVLKLVKIKMRGIVVSLNDYGILNEQYKIKPTK
ncbi:hypothetical protein ACFL1F_01285, partial [Chlamydiota bacterium]